MSESSLAAGLLFWAAIAVLPALAPAQSPSPPSADAVAKSRSLFDEGVAKAKAGDFHGACPLLQAADDLNPTNGTALQLATCYEKVDKPERAKALYERIVARGDAKYPERVDHARARLADIDRARREQPVDARSPPPATPVTAAPAAPAPSAPAAKPEPPPAPATAESPPSRIPAYVALGVGAAAIAAGGVFGVLALSQAGDVDDACPSGVCETPDDVIRQQAEQDAARTKGWVSTVAFGVGAVGVATGVVLLMTSGKRERAGGRRAVPVALHRRGITVRF